MPGLIEIARSRIGHQTSSGLGLGILGGSGGLGSSLGFSPGSFGGGIVLGQPGPFVAGARSAAQGLLAGTASPPASTSAVAKWGSTPALGSVLGANQGGLPDHLGNGHPVVLRDQRVRLAANVEQPARPSAWANGVRSPSSFQKSDRTATGSNSATGGVDDRSFALKVVPNGEAYAVSSPTYSPSAPAGLSYK